MEDLPPALKAWNGKATEISGKYVFTPELFVGNGSYENKTGVYIGENIRAKFHDRWRDVSGMVGMENGQVNWMFTNTGNLVIGSKIDECIQLGDDGRAIIPMIKTKMIEAGAITSEKIETGAITTDLLYPGRNERIVLERNYFPGSNDCKSIDTNDNGIRLKANADTYYCVRNNGIHEAYSRFGIWMKYDPYKGTGGHQGLNNYVYTKGNVDFYDATVNVTWLRYYGGDTLSDVSVKENIKFLDSDFIYRENKDIKIPDLTVDDIVKFLKETRMATYDFKYFKVNNFSLIAQNILKFKNVSNFLISKGNDKKLAVNLYAYTSMLHVGIQEVFKKNEELEKRVNTLESRIEELENLIREKVK